MKEATKIIENRIRKLKENRRYIKANTVKELTARIYELEFILSKLRTWNTK